MFVLCQSVVSFPSGGFIKEQLFPSVPLMLTMANLSYCSLVGMVPGRFGRIGNEQLLFHLLDRRN